MQYTYPYPHATKNTIPIAHTHRKGQKITVKGKDKGLTKQRKSRLEVTGPGSSRRTAIKEEKVLDHEYWRENHLSPALKVTCPRQLAESDGEAAAPATSLIWMPGGQPDAVLATYADGRVVSWCGRSVGVVCKDGGVDVRAALVGGLDNQVVTFTRSQVNIRDVNSLGCVTTMDQEMGGHLIGRGALWAVTGRGREIVGGGCGLTWWDARTGASSRSVGGVQVRGPALAWHPNANKMVSGSWGGGGDSVKVWEASTAKTTHVLYSDAANTSVRPVFSIRAGTPLVLMARCS
nr:uncharacterized protein LOC113814933 [Penaeus vannamei]